MMRRFPIYIIALLLLSVSVRAQYVQTIFTLAGDGLPGFYGDGGSAPACALDGPLGVAVDSAGNVYIEDYYNNRVRKVVQDLFGGTITTVAGNGTPGYTGDGTIATTAEIVPHGVALDKHANLFISDQNSSVIRRVDAKTQLISTYAGYNGGYGFSGDGGSARAAKFLDPCGMAVDLKGNLYIADAGNHAIRKVDPSGIITTIAGIGGISGPAANGYPATAAYLDSPLAVAVDRWGTIYITNYHRNVVQKLDTNNNIWFFAGDTTMGSNGYSGDGGAATLATLNNPKGLAVDTFGNVYIADADNNVIRMVNTSGIISTVVGNGSAGFGGDLGPVNGCNLHNPFGIAVDVFGSIYIADANNQRVRKTYSSWLGVNKVSSSGEKITVYPNPSSGDVIVAGCNTSDKVLVMDVTGRQVCDTWNVTSAAPQTLPTVALASGVYILQVLDRSGNKTQTVKLVKE